MTNREARQADGQTWQRSRRMPLSTVASVVVGFALAACNSIGPASVPRDRVDYSNALSDSWKDQMLLNMVRLRYGDAPTFLDVSSVISAYTIQGAVQASGTANCGVPSDTTTLPGGSGSVGALGGYVEVSEEHHDDEERQLPPEVQVEPADVE